MTWSYSGDPSASDLDAVRFRSGDTTESARWSVTDEEIAAILADTPDTMLAAVEVLDHLAARAVRFANSSAGDVRLEASRFHEQFSAMAEKLRSRAFESTDVYFGGLSHGEKEDLAADSDAVQPSFAIGLHDHPGTDSEIDIPVEDE